VPLVDLCITRVRLELYKKAYTGCRAKLHSFLTWDPNESGQLQSPAGFNSGKDGRSLGGPRRRSGRFG
jgi:hypothetical protein